MPASKPQNTTDEWETVAEARTKIIFDTDGDVFEGYYEGPEVIIDPNTGEAYQYLNFRKESGDGFTTSSNYQLCRAFETMPEGTFIRIVRLSESKVAKGTMTNFRVQTRK
jgi:hypothetical protein